LFQRPSSLRRSDTPSIQSRRTGPRATHPCERAPDSLHVSHDCRNRSAATSGRCCTPNRVRQHACEVFANLAAMPERLDKLSLRL
jgi:hypothetical protein